MWMCEGIYFITVQNILNKSGKSILRPICFWLSGCETIWHTRKKGATFLVLFKKMIELCIEIFIEKV